jgi:hypothetical protein
VLTEKIATSPTAAIMWTVELPMSATRPAIQPTKPPEWDAVLVVGEDMQGSLGA